MTFFITNSRDLHPDAGMRQKLTLTGKLYIITGINNFTWKEDAR